MPFPETSQIDANPDVQIYLAGLMMLVPGQDATSTLCDVYPLSHGNSHKFRLFVNENTPTPGYPFLELDETDFRDGIEIGKTQPRGVTKYEPGSSPSNPPFAFRDIVDFKDLFPGSHLNLGSTNRSLKIRDGVLCGEVRPDRARFERPFDNPTQCQNLPNLASIIGVRMNFDGMPVQIKWGGQSIALEPTSQGTKYEVWIINTRPKPPNENDFRHLYSVLTGIEPNEKWDCVFLRCGEPKRLETRPFDTPRIPCIPGVYDG